MYFFSKLATGLWVLIPIAVVYIVLNVIHLVWFWVHPEGFWSFMYFLRVFLLSIGVIVLALSIIIFGIIGIFQLIREFPVNVWKNLLKGVGVIVLLIVMPIIDFYMISYLELKMYDRLADRYKYINKSERFIDNREFERALKEAGKAKVRADKNREPSWFFPLTKYYSQTKDNQMLRADERYAADINYAYCLSQFDSLREKSISEYKSVLKLTETSMLSRQNEYKIFPLSALINIYLEEGDEENANLYNVQLLKHIQYASKEDIKYFMNCQELVAEHALNTGDNRTAAAVWINNLSLYKQAGLKQKTSTFLSLVTKAVWGHILRDDITAAGNLLEEISELASDLKKRDAYVEYLIIKSKYCEIVCRRKEGNKALLKKGMLHTLLTTFTARKDITEQFRDLAYACYEELKERMIDEYGEESREYVGLLLMMVNSYMSHHDMAKADEIFKSIFAIIEKNSLPAYLNNRSRLLFFLCQLQQGRQAADLSMLKDIKKQLFREATDRLTYLTEYERETYVLLLQEDIELINTILLSLHQKEAAAEIYNNILAAKNLSLYTNRHHRSVLSDTTNWQFRNAYLQLLQERDTASSGGIGSLIQEKEFDSRIRSLPGYRPYDPLHTTWENVRSALKSDEAAVEYFASYEPSDHKSSLNYYAIILQSKSTFPELIKLTTEDTLVGILSRKGNIIQSVNRIYSEHTIEKLRELVIRPVIDRAGTSGHFYLSLAARLHQISLPALFCGNGKDFEILGSTRVLAEHYANASYSRQATLFGDIDYRRTTVNGKNHLGKLSFTAQEIYDIQALLNRHAYQITLLRSDEGTEQAFRHLSGGKQEILHIATHGFYDKTDTSSRRITENNNLLLQTETSMLKCKLAFASGRSTPEYAIDKSNDGIISAREIAKLDLSGTDLVVLSACESGLGDLQGFEGVQGFQRAFTLAGVHNVLVSLWRISDKHTAEFMRLFYNFLMEGRSKPAALQAAQEKMKERYHEPYYWAGFMLIRE